MGCRAVFQGEIPKALELLKGMSRDQMVVRDPQGNTVSMLEETQVVAG